MTENQFFFTVMHQWSGLLSFMECPADCWCSDERTLSVEQVSSHVYLKCGHLTTTELVYDVYTFSYLIHRKFLICYLLLASCAQPLKLPWVKTAAPHIKTAWI